MSFRKLLDLVLPLECAGCHRPGAPWCARCARALHRLAFPDGPRLVTPVPPPPGVPSVHSWGVYADPLKAAVTAWKDEGRRDLVDRLAPVLAAALGQAVAAAVEDAGGPDGAPVVIVPAPSSRASRRARGDVPLEGLVRQAAGRLPPGVAEVVPVLVERRGVRDQAGLTTLDRRDNVSGAFGVRPRLVRVVTGRTCVVVDDVMTTGATLVECARALAEAGAAEVVGATIAVPRRRSTPRTSACLVGIRDDSGDSAAGFGDPFRPGARAG